MTTKNKLLEAAADILASSKKSASAMPPAKLPGEEVDLGGPTPQNSKPMDDSNKIATTKAAKSATAPTTKPSAASSDTQNHPQGGKKTMKEDEEMEDEDMVMMESELSEKKKKNTPTNPKLWQSALSWAKSRYKVCPSAYCNGAAVKRYNSQGGKWKKK